MLKYLVLIIFTACSQAHAVPVDDSPRKLTLHVCRDFCESSGVLSFTPGYYYKGSKLCSYEDNKYYCTKKDTISFACECHNVWSK